MNYASMTLDELREEARNHFYINGAINKPLMRECHRRLWDWLCEDATHEKYHWPGWDYEKPAYFGGKYIYMGCFMCEALSI